MTLLKEFCAENVEYVPAAIAAGAGRIELCDNLAVGGTSPSYGVVKAAVAYAHAHGAAVMAMARPRGGDFAYTEAELAMMADDISVACELGADGVVFGCAREGKLDVPATEALLAAVRAGEQARGSHVDVTFHMAFDAIDASEQFDAIDWLAAHGVTRILTHGGTAGTPIEGNLPRLSELIAHAAGRLTILPGAGINWENCERIADALGVSELHGTKIVRI